MSENNQEDSGVMKRGGTYHNKNAQNILDAQAMAICYMRYVDGGKPINKKDGKKLNIDLIKR